MRRSDSDSLRRVAITKSIRPQAAGIETKIVKREAPTKAPFTRPCLVASSSSDVFVARNTKRPEQLQKAHRALERRRLETMANPSSTSSLIRRLPASPTPATAGGHGRLAAKKLANMPDSKPAGKENIFK